MKKVNYITDIDKLSQLSQDEKNRLRLVQEKFVFRVNDYYLNLIDWRNPNDPIRQLVIPNEEELLPWGRLDASNEKAYTRARGAQHKYRDTVLLLVNEVCGSYCRYCFRKRLFMNDNDETSLDIQPGLEYIRANSDITNVLLTGGDPLVLSTKRLRTIIENVFSIDHVRIIRIGTKQVAFNPYRVLDDPELLGLISSSIKADKKIYIMNHFDHPRELTPQVREALDLLNKAGAILTNQCPLIKGVNDNSDILAELYSELSFLGCPPYYLFQGRPTAGNKPYAVPIADGFKIFHKASSQGSGLAKRARYCMSHETGKIEIVWVDEDRTILKYHRSVNPENYGRIMLFKTDVDACWLEDLEPFEVNEVLVSNPEFNLEPELS